MKSLYQAPVVIALGIGIAWAAVYGWKDRETFVPSPDRVVEGFVHALVTKRIDQAMNKVSADSEVTRSALEHFRKGLTAKSGSILHVSAQTVRIRGGHAESKASVTTQDREVIPLQFGLKLHRGEWQIFRLPEL